MFTPVTPETPVMLASISRGGGRSTEAVSVPGNATLAVLVGRVVRQYALSHGQSDYAAMVAATEVSTVLRKVLADTLPDLGARYLEDQDTASRLNG